MIAMPVCDEQITYFSRRNTLFSKLGDDCGGCINKHRAIDENQGMEPPCWTECIPCPKKANLHHCDYQLGATPSTGQVCASSFLNFVEVPCCFPTFFKECSKFSTSCQKFSHFLIIVNLALTFVVKKSVSTSEK